MKKLTFLIFFTLFGIAGLHADEQVRAVQDQLKAQGFYYGNVDGDLGSETSAAIRRYQIRNGLQVTGTLTQETLGALKVGGSAPATATVGAPSPAKPVSAATPRRAQPEKNVTESDRDFLRQQGDAVKPAPQEPPPQSTDRHVISPPVYIPPQPSDLSADFAKLYRRTPYENAPVEVQQSTLKSAQLRLVRDRCYNGALDGMPGPATERGIILFQGGAGLAQTGRLDLDTLRSMQLLPNERRVVTEPFYPPPYYGRQPYRVYRGIWVR